MSYFNMQLQNGLADFSMQTQNDFETAVDNKWMCRAEALVGLDSMPGGKWCSTGNVAVEAVVLGGYIRVFVGNIGMLPMTPRSDDGAWTTCLDPYKRLQMQSVGDILCSCVSKCIHSMSCEMQVLIGSV